MISYRSAILAASVAVATTSEAQSAASNVPRNFETRSELEAHARSAEAAQRTGEAGLIRSRLTQGDFQAGDRIVVTVEGVGGFTDTLTVQGNQMLPLPQLGEVPLSGVLRSELLPKLKTHVAGFLRNSTVRATPMVRLAVLGNVSRPGFYYTYADVPIGDVLMAAGGPTGEADMSKVQVRRGPTVILNSASARSALTNGSSIDMLHLRAGDEIDVGKKRRFNAGLTLSIASAVIGVIAAYAALRQNDDDN